nr:hypothetical protein [uncultured Dyadobacter sp.]
MRIVEGGLQESELRRSFLFVAHQIDKLSGLHRSLLHVWALPNIANIRRLRWSRGDGNGMSFLLTGGFSEAGFQTDQYISCGSSLR